MEISHTISIILLTILFACICIILAKTLKHVRWLELDNQQIKADLNALTSDYEHLSRDWHKLQIDWNKLQNLDWKE